MIQLVIRRCKAFGRYCTTGVWNDQRRIWKVNAIKTINLAVRSFLNTDLQNRASALTYNTILALVPALALLFAIGRGFGFQNLLQGQLFQFFPSQRQALETATEFVDSYLSQASQGIFVGVGLVVLLWTVISLMSNIEQSFNRVWGVTSDRSISRKVIDYTAILFLLPILMICSSGISVLASYIIVDNPRLKLLSPAIGPLLDFLPFLLTWISFTGMYLAFPNTKVHFKNAALSGAFAGISFQILQFLFLSGQIYVSKYNAIYGSFAFLPLLLIWMQLVWTITLAGAVLCYSSQNIFQFNFTHDINSISFDYRRKITIAILTVILHRFEEQKPPITPKDFAERYLMPARLVSDILNELEEAGLLSKVVTNEQTYSFQPAIDPSAITLGLVVRKLNEQGSDDFIPDFDNKFSNIIATLDRWMADNIERGGSIFLTKLHFKLENTDTTNLPNP